MAKIKPTVNLKSPLRLYDQVSNKQIGTLTLEFVCDTLDEIVKQFGNDPAKALACVKLAAAARIVKESARPIDLKAMQAAIDATDCTQSDWLNRAIGRYQSNTGHSPATTKVNLYLAEGHLKRGTGPVATPAAK